MTRDDFAGLIDDHKLKVGIEIGVHCGGFSYGILSKSKIAKLYGLDPWVRKWRLNVNPKQEAFEKLKQFGDRSELIVGTSPEEAIRFSDGYFDFVYIDADHIAISVENDLNAWWPKLKQGGLFAGHDYCMNRRLKIQVKKVVDEFAIKHNVELHVTDEQRLPSWFIWKP